LGHWRGIGKLPYLTIFYRTLANPCQQHVSRMMRLYRGHNIGQRSGVQLSATGDDNAAMANQLCQYICAETSGPYAP
jgi:hypothetical protein